MDPPNQTPLTTSGDAILSLWMAVAGLVVSAGSLILVFATGAELIWLVFLGSLVSLMALIVGYAARRKIRTSNGSVAGEGHVTVAIILGWIGVLGAVLFGLYIVFVIISVLRSL